MATNKKITELTELSEADLSDDDVLPIVDISAGTTNKVRKSTLASALSGVASITATSPIAVNQSTGSVVVSTGTIPITSGGTGETTASAALAALGGISDPTTTRGDIITKGASTLDRLPIGAVNTVLRSDGTDPEWGTVATSELTGNINLTSQVTGTLPLTNGGTNATTASGARTSLGAAASGANTDITSLAADIAISGSTSGDALRITQTGAGNALLVEDSANPDSSPFVVDASGKVGIGTLLPDTNLHVVAATAGGQFIVASTETDATNKVGTVATQHYTNAEEPVLGLAIQSTSTENKVFIGGVFTQFNAATEIRFYTTSNNTTLGGSERVRINSSGNVGIGTTAPAKQLHITKAAKADIGTLTDGATITPDFDANQNFSVTLGGNRTLANPSNIDAGQTGSIFVVQDGTGSRTLSFGSYWKFAGGTAPTLSTAAGSVDRIDYIVYTTTAIHAVATLNVS